MTTLRVRDVDDPSSVFLVERYLPPTAAANLAAMVSRTAGRCELSADAGTGSGVRYLNSVYLPSEDTCFCLFRAEAADAVRSVNDEAEFTLDRITSAILLYPVSAACSSRNR